MKNNRLVLAMFMAFAVLASSCEEEEFRQSLPHGDGGLYFKIVSVNEIGTKAPSDVNLETVDLSSDGISLFVTPSVEVNRTLPGGAMPETKGEIIDKATLIDETASTGIPLTMITHVNGSNSTVSGWLRKNNDDISDDYWSLYNTDAAVVTNEDKIDWDEAANAKASFFSYYDRNEDVVSNLNYTNLSFTYTGIESKFTLGTSETSAAVDAMYMDDLLVAYTDSVDHKTAHGTTEQVNAISLSYYHPLATVRFKVAPVISSGDTIIVDRVTINNLKTKGTVTYNRSSIDGFKDKFIWSLSDGYQEDYAQKYTGDIDDMTFFVVPQDLTNVVVTFNIVHKKAGTFPHEHQVTAPAGSLGTTTWNQGYIYNYTLNTSAVGKVDIDLKETFTDGATVKKNVTVENKREATVFVRAKAVANWCSESGKVLAPCPLDSTNPVINTSDWLLGKDGYYYCKVPVVGYHESPVFIQQFTQPNDISAVPNGDQVKNLHVEMTIVAQGIESDRYSPTGTTFIQKAWGDSNGKILLNDGRDLLSFLKF